LANRKIPTVLDRSWWPDRIIWADRVLDGEAAEEFG
jgi:hypothetical protein